VGGFTKVNEMTKGQYGCVIRMTLKDGNVFINVTNLKGQTIMKFSSGLIHKKKKLLRTAAK